MASTTPGTPKLLGDSNRLRVAGVNALGPLERQIMDYLWNHESTTVGEVHKYLRHIGQELAYTTIMTTMSRLAQKELLNVNKSKVTYTYSAAMNREEYTDSMIGRVLDVLVDTDAEAVFEHLAKRLRRTTPVETSKG